MFAITLDYVLGLIGVIFIIPLDNPNGDMTNVNSQIKLTHHLHYARVSCFSRPSKTSQHQIQAGIFCLFFLDASRLSSSKRFTVRFKNAVLSM